MDKDQLKGFFLRVSWLLGSDRRFKKTSKIIGGEQNAITWIILFEICVFIHLTFMT
jgi:hypothetical protein